MILSREIFKAMEARDPDGGERWPKDDDYKAFEQWAVETYGRQAYDAYMTTDEIPK